MIPGVTVTSDPTKFGQGMILPTTNALKQHSPVAAKKNEVKTNKTQVGPSSCPDLAPVQPHCWSADLWLFCVVLQISPAAKCSSSTAPCTTGDRILTCSFDLKETFQLMNSTGRSSAKRYSNRLGKTRRNQNRQEIQERVINDAPWKTLFTLSKSTLQSRPSSKKNFGWLESCHIWAKNWLQALTSPVWILGLKLTKTRQSESNQVIRTRPQPCLKLGQTQTSKVLFIPLTSLCSSCRCSHAHQRCWTVAVGGNSRCWAGASVESSHSWWGHSCPMTHTSACHHGNRTVPLPTGARH